MTYETERNWSTRPDLETLDGPHRRRLRYETLPSRAAVAFAVLCVATCSAAAQDKPMAFPSFNSVVAKPVGVPVTGAGSDQALPAPTAATPAPAKPKPKAASSPKPTKVAAKQTEAAAKAGETKGMAIAVLVNDEPITGYEIEQRQRVMGLSANIGEKAQANFKRALQDPKTSERLKAILGEVIKENPGKTREQVIAVFEERKKQFAMNLQKQAVESAKTSMLPTLKKGALDELIDERLKLQEAKRLNAVASDAEVSKIIQSLAEKNKMTEAQFATHLSSMGADIEGMRGRFRAMLSWNDVIRRRFGHQVAITERDVDRIVSQGPAGQDSVELLVQRVTLTIPEKINQKLVAQRMADAEGMRSKFTDCKSLPAMASGVANAKLEDLGTRKPSSLTEPTRSLLLAARDGEMVPPTVGTGGVELYAVCGRTVVKADEGKRNAAQEELRQREFSLFAERHLKNLRQDALIEYR
jgi:peptidyl-prolyl cis-trans isomerase SurA